MQFTALRAALDDDTAIAWVKFAFRVWALYHFFPTVQQPPPLKGALVDDSGKFDHRRTRGCLLAINGAYAPQHVTDPLLQQRDDGSTRSKAYSTLTASAIDCLQRQGRGLEAEFVAGDGPPPLVGTFVHLLPDALPSVEPVASGGQRLDSEKLCAESCKPGSESAAVLLSWYTALFKMYKVRGFNKLVVATFSEPASFLHPILGAACDNAGLELELLMAPGRGGGLVPFAAHPEQALTPWRQNALAWQLVGIDSMVQQLLAKIDWEAVPVWVSAADRLRALAMVLAPSNKPAQRAILEIAEASPTGAAKLAVGAAAKLTEGSGEGLLT